MTAAESHAARRPVAADPAAPNLADLLELGIDAATAVQLVHIGRRLDARWRRLADANEGGGR